MFKILLAVLLLPSLSLAQVCPQNVSKAKPGDSVPCHSWIVSESTMQEIAKNKQLLENKENQILTFEKLRVLDKSETEFYQKRSERLAQDLSKQESKRFWSTLGAFALGVVITGFATKVAIESVK